MSKLTGNPVKFRYLHTTGFEGIAVDMEKAQIAGLFTKYLLSTLQMF
jgi:hypothetical protein